MPSNLGMSKHRKSGTVPNSKHFTGKKVVIQIENRRKLENKKSLNEVLTKTNMNI